MITREQSRTACIAALINTQKYRPTKNIYIAASSNIDIEMAMSKTFKSARKTYKTSIATNHLLFNRK